MKSQQNRVILKEKGEDMNQKVQVKMICMSCKKKLLLARLEKDPSVS